MTLFYIGIPILLIVICVFDIRYNRIPLYLNLPLLISAVFYSVVSGINFFYIIINPITGFLFFFIIRFITKKGIGLGDAILSASIASILGIRLWLPAITAASLIALGFILFIKLFRGKNIKQMRIPFAPFMAAGAIILMVVEMI